MYRVTRGEVVRREDGDTVTYEVGDEFDATDAEIRSFGDRLEEVEANAVQEDSEPEDPGDDAARAVLEENGVDPDDYDALRQAASEYDDVDGRNDADTLRTELAEKLG